MKGRKEDQLSIIMQCVKKVITPLFGEVTKRLDAIEERQGISRPRMKLKRAAEVYDVNLGTLRTWCLRGDIPGAVKKGKAWYVTAEGMDQVFMVEKRRKRGR